VKTNIPDVAEGEAVYSGPAETLRKGKNLPPSAVRLLTQEAMEGFGSTSRHYFGSRHNRRVPL
jgi:hypothetical protein